MGFFGRLFGRDGDSMRTMKKIVGEAHIYVTDGECVDTCEDYIDVVKRLATISGGAFAPEEIKTDQEDDTRTLRIRTRMRWVRGTLEDSDWIDADALLNILNRAVHESTGRFVVFQGTNDQCVAFAFGTREQLETALEKGVEFTETFDHAFDLDPSDDGDDCWPDELTPEQTMRSIVGDSQVCVIDSDVTTPADVITVVHALAKISNGMIVPERVHCTADGDLLFETRGRIVGGRIDFALLFHDDNLLEILNDAVRDGPERFVVFEPEDAAATALAFGTREQFATAEDRGIDIETYVDDLWAEREPHPAPLYEHATTDPRSTRIAVSPDGTVVATLADDRVRMWDRRTFAIEDRTVALATCVAFDAKGELLVGTQTGVRRGDSTLGTHHVVALARTGRFLAAGSVIGEGEGRVEVWNLDTNERIAEWSAPVNAIAIAPGGDVVAAGDAHGVTVWNIDGTVRFTHAIDEACWGVAFSPDGTRLAIGEIALAIVDAASGNTIVEHGIAEGFALDISPDGMHVAFASDSEVTLLSTTEIGERSLSVAFLDGAHAVAWLPNGDLVATGSLKRGAQRVWLWPTR